MYTRFYKKHPSDKTDDHRLFAVTEGGRRSPRDQIKINQPTIIDKHICSPGMQYRHQQL